MEYIKIQAYKDEHFNSKEGGAITLPFNPESLKFGKGIRYNEDRQLGSTNGDNAFSGYEKETLSFDAVIDCSGVILGTFFYDSAYTLVKEIEECLYDYNSDIHRPNYVKICYGELLFKGQLTKMDTEYKMFNSFGVPIRAKLSFSFTEFCESSEARKKNHKNSPDISRLVTVKEGETLALLCKRMYGDSTLVPQVARFNNLNGFRNIPAGTELLFPPLRKS